MTSSVISEAAFHLRDGEPPTFTIERSGGDGFHWVTVTITCPPDCKHRVVFFGTPDQLDGIENTFTQPEPTP